MIVLFMNLCHILIFLKFQKCEDFSSAIEGYTKFDIALNPLKIYKKDSSVKTDKEAFCTFYRITLNPKLNKSPKQSIEAMKILEFPRFPLC